MRFLAIFCFLGCLSATPSLVSHACSGSASGSASPSVTTLTTTGANFIVVVSADYNQGDTISDSLSNSWTQFSQRIGVVAVTMWYSSNPTVGAGQQFTVTGNYNATCVLAWSGLSSADVTNSGNYVTGTSVETGAFTPIADGDLLISGTSFNLNNSTSDGAAIDSGFTISDTLPGTIGQNVSCVVGWKIQAVAAAIDPIWSGTSTVSRTAIVAAFKAGTSGGGARVLHRVTQQ